MPRRSAPLALLLASLAAAPACGGGDDGGGGGGGTPDLDSAPATYDAASSDDAAAPDLDAAEVNCTPLGAVTSTCETGSGVVTSEIPDVTVDPVVSAWYQDFGEDCRSGIFIDERASDCDPGSVTGELGHFVSIFFCSTPAVGSYTVVSSDEMDASCPDGGIVSITVQDEEFEDDAQAASGTVTLDSIDGCLSGSFDAATALDEELSGSFAAYTCP